jgi:hypothetical protein
VPSGGARNLVSLITGLAVIEKTRKSDQKRHLVALMTGHSVYIVTVISNLRS